MKQKNLKTGIAGILFLLLGIGLFAPTKSKAETPFGVSFQVFYDELMPYGDWVKDVNYGYIWLPAVGADFHPYGSNGHWMMTDYGNTWVSYYDWGWAPFHYGRWYFDDYYQSWAWIPGYDWGPAWVNWRTGGGYYGWAPLGPGVSISVRVNIPSFHWVFLPSHRIYHHHAYNYYAPRKTKVRIYNNTTVINNTVVYNNNRYVSGPNRREVERVTRHAVPVYSVRGSQSPGRASVSRNSVEIYRPDLSASRGRTVEARPSRVASADQVKSNRAQSRNSYSTSPSRNARGTVSSSPSSRSANPASRPSTRTESASPSRSNSGTRQATPSRNGGSFEAKPYEQGRTKTTSPATRSQSPKTQAPSSRTQTSPSRSSTGRESSGKVSQPNTRTQQARPQGGSRTQSSPSVKQSQGSSQGRVSQPTKSRQSSPTVRSSGSSSSRTSSSTPRTNSRTSPTKKSTSSASTQSSSSRRGNN